MGTVFYLERKGHKYAYEATSKRIPGRKNPKTENVYLGKVDPATGKIIPKKPMKRPPEEYAKLYGPVHLLDAVQSGMRVREDLDAAFPGRGSNILGAAMSQVLDPSSFDDIHYVMEGSVVPERLRLRGKLSPATMSDLSKEVGASLSCMDDFFGRRASKSGSGSFALDLTSVSSYSSLGGWAERGHDRDGERLRQINVAMVTDVEGVPLMFRMFPGSVADLATLRLLVGDMRRLGCKGERLVMDRGFEPASNVKGLLDLGTPFVLPSNAKAEAVKKLLTRAIGDLHGSASLAVHDDVAYKYAEYEMAVVPKEDDDAFEHLVRLPQNEKGSKENNERFDGGERIKAFVVYSPRKAADDLQSLTASIDRAERELDGKKFRRPEKRFDELPPSARRCLDWSVDDEGAMRLSRRQNAVAFADNRSGMFVMLASAGTDWSEAMRAYDTRNRVEEAFKAYKNDLDGGRMRTGDPERARGRLFIKFVALILRVRIMNVLKAEGTKLDGLTVEQMFRSLSTVMAIGAPGDWRLTAVTRTNRQIFEAFGIEPPKSGAVVLS